MSRRQQYFDKRGKPLSGKPRDTGRRCITVARHEAAHAVVSELLGMRVLRVVITGSATGFCEHMNARSKLAQAIVSIAGTVADHYWNRLPWRLWSSGDGKNIHRLGYRDGLSKALVEDFGRMLLNEPKVQRQVHAVARALKIRDLSGKEVRDIMKLAR